MVIQRWQSVLLLLATICMVVYMFINPQITELNSNQTIIVELKDNPGLWIPAVVSALLYFIDIFLFKNFTRQLWVLLAANGCAIITGALLVWATMSDSIPWTVLFPVAAIALGLLARTFIIKDRKTLRSYDRLR